MDVLFNCLEFSGFTRSSVLVGKPIVVLAVPGAGKTTAIRRLLSLDTRFQAYTFGTPDFPSVTGRHIRGVVEREAAENCEYVVVDEFQRGDYLSLNPFAVFGDVSQFYKAENLCIPSNWFKSHSHRVPLVVCKFLQQLGFSIEGSAPGALRFAKVFDAELEGTIISFDKEVHELLSRHSCEHKSVDDCVGKEFEVVTLILSSTEIEDQDKAKFYCAVTRARKSLLILIPELCELRLCGNAFDTSA
nr:putative TGB1 protein [Red clover carlavirus 1]